MKPLTDIELNFKNSRSVYKGKVRNVYRFGENKIALLASDRISAFDVILPRAIPYKGEILSKIAIEFLRNTSHIVPNWLEITPDPNICIGKDCEMIKLEMVIRGYLCGHSWRVYNNGERLLCGNKLKDGMQKNQKLDFPIITPAIKAEDGEHDEDVFPKDIVNKGILSEEKYKLLEEYTHKLYKYGCEYAENRGLILADTKYEFGIYEGKIYLIDEIHTPDSSRYFYKKNYAEDFYYGNEQSHLSKEFVREWLIENGFQGLENQQIPEMTDEVVLNISNKYIELYESLLGKKFVKTIDTDINARIINNLKDFLLT